MSMTGCILNILRIRKWGMMGSRIRFYSNMVLPAGGYSDGNVLAAQIQTAMNNGVNSNANISFAVAWDANSFSINIACSGAQTSFLMCSPNSIIFEDNFQKQVFKKTDTWGTSFDPNNLKNLW
jgi:hypothetical protein